MLPPAKRENLPLRGKVFTSQIFVLTKGPCRADFIWTYKPAIKRNHSFHLIESGLVNVIIAQTATILVKGVGVVGYTGHAAHWGCWH